MASMNYFLSNNEYGKIVHKNVAIFSEVFTFVTL